MLLFRKALTDIQQQVNRIQLTSNQGHGGNAGQPAAAANFDTSALNEIRDTVRGLKIDSNSILQKSVRKSILDSIKLKSKKN